MATYQYEIEKLHYLDLGQEGETEATVIEIDMKSWVDELAALGFDNPCFHILFKPYNANVPLEGSYVWTAATGILSWTITTAITAVAGKGYTEIRAMNHPDNGLLKKSRVIPTSVNASVSGVEGGIPPAPYDSWLNQILALEDDLNNALSGAVRKYVLSQTNYSTPPDDSAAWSETMPDLAAHKGWYLWTKTTISWSTGSQTDLFNISYIASDADGAIASVNGYTSNIVVLDGGDIKMDRSNQNSLTLRAAIEAKLDTAKIVYTSDGNPPTNPTTGTIWLKPKAVS